MEGTRRRSPSSRMRIRSEAEGGAKGGYTISYNRYSHVCRVVPYYRLFGGAAECACGWRVYVRAASVCEFA